MYQIITNLKLDEFKQLRLWNSKKFRKENFNKQMKYFEVNQLLHIEKQFQIDYLIEEEIIHRSKSLVSCLFQFIVFIAVLNFLVNRHFLSSLVGMGIISILYFYAKQQRNQSILTKFWNENINIPFYNNLLKEKYNL